jgi:SAM-dependent methyltransferase
MGNNNVSWFSPDKITKDLQWDYLSKASKFACGKLLDVGCGQMPYRAIFLPRVRQYIGIDKHSSAADIKKDFLKATIPAKSYDTVLCTQVLEHTHEPQKFLAKINKVLKRNGVIILTVPFTGYLHEVPHDYYRYTKFGLQYLLKITNFRIVYIKAEGNWIASIGQEIISYLEPTYNRLLLKYPKLLLQVSILLLIKAFSHLPERFTKSEYSTINYIVVAKKK